MMIKSIYNISTIIYRGVHPRTVAVIQQCPLVDRCLSEQQSSSPAQIDPTGFEPESEGTTGKIVIVVVLHTKAV